MSLLAVVSGGLDSVTLAYFLRHNGALGHVLTLDYGQRHAREIVCAERAAQALGAGHTVLRFPALGAVLPSALTTPGAVVPDAEYAPDNLAATIVPNRNAIILALAYGVADSLGLDGVAIGVHAGDHALYSDCRPEFIRAYKAMEREALGRDVMLEAPFLLLHKEHIVTIGAGLRVPFADTWSCYQGEKRHCGRCATCRERRQAFVRAGVKDPTEYE